MAARHLQRLRVAQSPELADVGSSSEEEVFVQKAPFNPFDLLSDGEVTQRFLHTTLLHALVNVL